MNDFRNHSAAEKIGDELHEAREHLSRAGESFKGAVQERVTELGEEAQKYMKITGIAASIAFTGYFLWTMMRGNRSKKIVPTKDGRQQIVIETRQEHPLVTSIKTSIATFLLSIAKEKIITFIEKMTEKHEEQSAARAGVPQGTRP
ncbi:MAG: hypothetical protein V4543_15350 [Bacteroidota bacterium]